MEVKRKATCNLGQGQSPLMVSMEETDGYIETLLELIYAMHVNTRFIHM